MIYSSSPLDRLSTRSARTTCVAVIAILLISSSGFYRWHKEWPVALEWVSNLTQNNLRVQLTSHLCPETKVEYSQESVQLLIDMTSTAVANLFEPSVDGVYRPNLTLRTITENFLSRCDQHKAPDRGVEWHDQGS